MSTVEETLQKFREEITSKNDSIRITSIHGAKGLENDRVFILDYYSLPMISESMLPWQMEQERNIKYVALTRTKREMYLALGEASDKNEIKEDEDDVSENDYMPLTDNSGARDVDMELSF
jgi:superfamily I DNA/RNA helicase